MKFKVGDKVKLVRTKDESFLYQIYLGKEYTIKDILNADFGKYAVLKETNVIFPYLKNLELVNKKYTYEDLKKSPVGTKVTFEDGTVLVKDNSQTFENDSYTRDLLDLENFKSRILGKIIKIEEPEYQTVYESKPEILDEVEKRYLRGVIRPFKENVRFITKRRYWIDSTEYNDISICIRNNSNIILPKFKANKMYKGMEMEKTYTLEELGL